MSESEAPNETTGDLLLKYIKGNIGAAIALFEHLMSSLERATVAADADVASKVAVSVRLGQTEEDVDILKAIAPKEDLGDIMIEVISVLLRTLEDINARRLDDAEKELLELMFNLDKIFDRVFDGCTRAGAGGGKGDNRADSSGLQEGESK